MSDLHAYTLVPVDTVITSTMQRLPKSLLCTVVWTVRVACTVDHRNLLTQERKTPQRYALSSLSIITIEGHQGFSWPAPTKKVVLQSSALILISHSHTYFIPCKHVVADTASRIFSD